MYAPFFGLSKEPFSIAPDPRFLFMSDQHREALAHLLYGLAGGGGFVLLTGGIGAGKTTVCRCFLEQVPAHCTVAYVFNPKLTAIELLQTVCGEFGIALPADRSSVKAHVDALNAFLLAAHAQGRQAVLVIDEAQSLSADVLEQLRLLTNLETAERKLLQIVLIGQPELRDVLARPDLEQLAQRVIARYHLGALSYAETQQYIRHRLQVAGPNAPLPFDKAALARIHALSGGVPRRINLLADRALLGAYAQGQARVDKRTVARAAQEVFGSHRSPAQPLRWLAAAAVLVLTVAAAAWAWQRTGGTPAVAAASPAAAGPGQMAPSPASAQLASSPAVARTEPSPPFGPKASSPPLAQVASSSPLAPMQLSPPLARMQPSPPSAAATSAAAAASAAASAQAASAPSLAAAAQNQAPASGADAVAALLAAAPVQEGTAWRELALRWNVAIGEGDACTAVQQAGLACFRSAGGGLPVVRQLARPGLLTLRAAGGPPVFAVLTALDEQQATLVAGQQRVVIGLPALAGIWRGEFATLWRTPPRWRDGADGVDAQTRAWIEQQLAGAGFADAARPLRERVWAFQLAQGLAPDGRAGPLTLMRLGRAAEPQLAAQR